MPGDTDVVIVAAFVLADGAALGEAVPGLSSGDELDIHKLNVTGSAILTSLWSILILLQLGAALDKS